MAVVVWIDKDALAANKQDGGTRPCIVIDGAGPRRAVRQVDLLDDQGRVVASLKQGARPPVMGAGTVTVWLQAPDAQSVKVTEQE